MENQSGLSPEKARQLAKNIKKELTQAEQWCSIQEINQPGLKFIRIEASIKVKQ